MENKEDDIENLFRERFENDEAPVSPKVWQNIKKTLPEDKDKFGFSFSQNIVLWSIAGVLLVSIATWAYFNFFKEQVISSNVSLTKNFAYETDKNKAPMSDSISTTTFEKLPTNHSTGDNTDLIQSNDLKENQSTLANRSLSNKANSNTSNYSVNSIDRSPHDHADASLSIETQSYPNSLIIENKKDKYKKTESNSSTVFTSSDKTVRKQKSKNQPTIAPTNKSSTNNFAVVPSRNDKDTKQLSHFPTSSKEKLATENTMGNVDHTNTNRDNSQKTLPLLNNNEATNLSSIKTNSKQSLLDTSLNIVHHTVLIPPTTDSASAKIDNKTISSEMATHSSTSPHSLNDKTENKIRYSSNASNQLFDSDTLSPFTDIDNQSAKQYTSKDSLTKIDLVSAIDRQVHADSSVLNNNSLSKNSLTSSSFNQDSSLVVIDSIQLATKDSVVTETSTKKAKDQSKLLRRISIDLVAATLLTGASTKGTDSLHKSTVAGKNKNDKSSLGYSLGLMVNYKLSERLHVSTGIVYNTFSEQYNFNYNLKTSQSVYIDSTWQNIQVDSINRDIKTKDQYSFISIPLQLSYTFLVKEKLKLSATAGIRSNILLKGVTYLPNAGKTDVIEIRSGFNSISFTYLIALEATYQLNEHTALLLQPVFMYGASSIYNKASGLNQKLYGMGLTLGLRFTF